MNLQSNFSDIKDMLEMKAEDLAPYLLKELSKSERGQFHKSQLSPNDQSFIQTLGTLGYSIEQYEQLVSEAWAWLQREVFIAEILSDNNGWSFVTNAGKQILQAEDFNAYHKASLFPNDLDAVLTRNVKPLFLRGRYDTVIFESFKEVEIRIRSKTGLGNDVVGAELARKAFGPECPLEDKAIPMGEREGTAHLFAGAFQAFRNPAGHRNVQYSQAREVIDIISFANQLLRIIERSI